MVRRSVCIILCICAVLSLGACAAKEQPEITCDEVAAAYEAAGYSVFHNHAPEIGNMVCYLEIHNDDDAQILFHFYETAEEAEAEQLDWNVLLWLYSVIYGDPTWVHTETYRNIEIEYTDKSLYTVFEKLIN